MKHTARVLLASGIVACSCAAMAAYTLAGSKWGVTEVPYYVNPGNSDVSQSAALAAIQAGAQSWNQQANTPLRLVFAGNTNATSATRNGSNEVFFRNDANGSTIASTYRWTDGYGKILESDIIFYDGGISFFAGTSGCSGGSYIEDPAAHEFGHALGLSHSSQADATMYPTTIWCSDNWRSLHADDIGGAQALYGVGTSEPSAPAAPRDLRVSTVSDSSLSIAWTDAANTETGFSIERSTGGGSFAPVAQLGANTTSFQDDGLSPGTTYSYRVAAYNSEGSSSYSNVGSATTVAASGTSPISLSARGYKVKNAKKTELTWNGSFAAKVDIYRNGARIITTPNDGLHTDAPSKGSAFSYKVCSEASNECSNAVTVTF